MLLLEINPITAKFLSVKPVRLHIHWSLPAGTPTTAALASTWCSPGTSLAGGLYC